HTRICCKPSSFVLYWKKRLEKDGICSMSQQHPPISLWLRLCRWLWKYPLPFLLSTLLVNVAINIGSTWLITPATTKAIPDTSSLGNIAGWVNVHWAFSLFLGAI